MLDNHHISILDHDGDSIDHDDSKPYADATINSKTSVEPNQQALKKPSDEVTINDLLGEVRKLWFELDEKEGKLELELKTVAWKIVYLKALPDYSTACKYIKTTLQVKQLKFLDYDDFNSLFSKGIFKFVLMNKSKSIENEYKADSPEAKKETSLEFKMMQKKN